MAAPPTPRNVGALLGARYELVAPIGTGVSSRVFLAVDNQLRRRVAVKVLHETLAGDERFLARFRAEARAAAALAHPNILAVYDWGEDRDGDGVVPYLVTEFLPGGSLRTLLDSGVRLSPSQALQVGLEASRALGHAHERGLVHRDVKPANLLFDAEGHLRLADFGLARALAEASWTEPAGASMGTTRYASAEQVLGQRIDGRSDVYSLGLVLMEAVTGVVPLLADTPAGTMGLRTQHEVDVPMEFGSLRGPLLRATALDVEERSDAGELEISLMSAAERMVRPEPLPLAPTPGRDQTSELRISDDLAGLTVLGAASGSAEVTERITSAEDGSDIDLPGDGTTTGADPDWSSAPFVRDPIVVASEHEALVSSRPSTLGAVEPFSMTATAVEPADGDAPVPRRRLRRVLPWVLLVLLVAGGAAAWWFFVRVPTHEVPDLVGTDIVDVRAAADDNSWVLDESTVVRVDDTAPGQVVEQDPAPGEQLAEGETLAVTVSLGPTLVPWPDLGGLPVDEAAAAIAAAELVLGSTATAFDEEVPAGAVVSALPQGGVEAIDAEGLLPKGTVVDLVVSDGPAPRAVPGGLVGVSLDDATAALEAVQLGAEVSESYSDTVPAGVVVSVGLEAGVEVARGTEVPLVVSLGPEPIPVPNVAGQTGSAAAAALEAAGFTVSGIEGSPTGTVLATDPPAGEPHQRGTAVRIFTRR